MSRLLIEQSVRKIAQNTQRTIRKKSITESKEKVLKPCGFQDLCGSGEDSNLTYRVRVCCATFTQTRYIRSFVSHEQVLLYRKTRICQGFFEKIILPISAIFRAFFMENTYSACIIRSGSHHSASEIRRRVCFFFKFHPSPVPRSPLFHVILYFQARKRYGPGS